MEGLTQEATGLGWDQEAKVPPFSLCLPVGRPGGLCLQKLGPSDGLCWPQVPSAPSCSIAEASTLFGPQFPPWDYNNPAGPNLWWRVNPPGFLSTWSWGQSQSLGSTLSREKCLVPHHTLLL